MGYIYGVFAAGTAAGPLIGGLFADQDTILGAPGWRWIFYANIPFGLIAIAIITIFLKLPVVRRPHKIDFLGAFLVVAGVTAIIMATALGGNEFAWSSPTIIGLGAAGVVLVVLFAVWERKASEPIQSMALWRNSIFTVTTLIAFIMGVASTGILSFVALFLQIANGDSTEAGISLLPLMLGLLFTSIITGNLITKTGRYKIFPVIGMLISCGGLVLLSRLDEHTSVVVRDLYMAVIGIGMGLVMQVLTVAVQNSVERKDMGAASAANPFFRAMGGALGTAAFGSILAARVTHHVTDGLNGRQLPGGVSLTSLPSPTEVRAWPADIQTIFTDAFVKAMSELSLIAAGFVAAGFVLVLFLKELPLKGAAPAKAAAPAQAGPASPTANSTAPAAQAPAK